MQSVWILGDQLMTDHPALARAARTDTVVLMIESRARGALHRYHQVKLALVYAAMRQYAAALRSAGWRVDYVALEDSSEQPLEDGELGFEAAVSNHLAANASARVLMAEPNSHAEVAAITRLVARLGVTLVFLPSSQFLVGRAEFAEWASGRKRLLMEDHYRGLRRRHGWLMRAEGKPEGGAWNFDHDNRATHAAWRRAGATAPALPRVVHDAITREAIAMVARRFAAHPGRAADLWLPVTRVDALVWLHSFIAERLPGFGTWEDMMSSAHPFLHHSVLSPLINFGLLSPRECIEAAIEAHERGAAPLNSVEGFVRQISGWREYINGVYWLRGPGYSEENGLGATRPLPAWFYTADTPMNCVQRVLAQTLALGWNHHIQRLMVLGNFLLLAGVAPRESLRWFLEMYVDAYDWVMAANVIGMSQHADGGFVATKPYVASGAYIRRMSDYCDGCQFDPKLKTGPRACPFNYLYWDFIDRHAERFGRNARMAQTVRAWQGRGRLDQQAVRESARVFLAQHVPAKPVPAP